MVELFELKHFNQGNTLVREGQVIYYDYSEKKLAEEIVDQVTPKKKGEDRIDPLEDPTFTKSPSKIKSLAQVFKFINQNEIDPTDNSNFIYLVLDGIVRFETQNNPFRRKEYQK